MKKGYRLTPEEEAIMRGEFPGENIEQQSGRNIRNDSGENTLSSPNKKSSPFSRILPILFALGMLVVISYLFVYLIPGKSTENKQDTVRISISAEQKSVFKEKLTLSEDEEAAFWPVYTRFCDEMWEIRRNHREWLSEQGRIGLNDTSFEDFMTAYSAEYDQLKKTVLRFSEAFAALLGEERIPVVLTLYEEWQGKEE